MTKRELADPVTSLAEKFGWKPYQLSQTNLHLVNLVSYATQCFASNSKAFAEFIRTHQSLFFTK